MEHALAAAEDRVPASPSRRGAASTHKADASQDSSSPWARHFAAANHRRLDAVEPPGSV
jgi:hypothetical protein